MPIITVPDGGQARAIHVQQIINWLRGLPSYSEAVSFTGVTNNDAYALTVANRGVGGLGLAVKNALRTVTLFEVKESGSVVRPNAATGTFFRVRNFLDNTDLFAVTDTGVALGGETVATVTGTQTLTNKTLTAPNIVGGVVTTFMEYLNQGSAPATPTAGRIRVYENADAFKMVDSTGTVKQFATLSGTEVLTNKTLTSPTIATPAITGYIDIGQAAAPANPGASTRRLYSITGENLLKHRDSVGTVKELVDLDSVQTLSNKTISGLVLTGPSLANPIISNYIEMQHSSAPGGTAGASRIYARNDNNMYYQVPGGAIHTILTSSNTPSIAALSMARPLMLSGG